MGFLKEFKEFAVKGNVMDLAVGVIIGGAFGKIVTAVVDDIIMPVVAAIIGKPDFSNMYLILKQGDTAVPNGASLEDARKVANTVIFAYGDFITVIINFLLLAFCIFLLVKGMNAMKRKQEEEVAAPAEPTSTDKLLMEIRDQLKK